MTDFRLLGPLEVVEDGERVALPRGKPRSVLARLLLDANRPLPAETIIDGIWGESPPVSARKVLQVYVSQLRKALGPDRIETHAAGYLLRVHSSELDLARFEQLAESAQDMQDPGRRATLLTKALSLWRGVPLAEFTQEPFAAAVARRLSDLRVHVLEQRIDADLELGRHERVVPELEALVAEEPLREQPRRQLMLALYRSGRQAEALSCYREGRRRIVDALGIEPSRELQELERGILQRDPALDAVARRLAPSRGPVVSTTIAPLDLLLPLCADGRELVLLEIVAEASELPGRSEVLEGVRKRSTEIQIRTAAFTSRSPAEDVNRVTTEQQAELLMVHEAALIPAAPQCDVALLAADRPFSGGAPVVVPFGGSRDEWAALELGAWLARAHDLPLTLMGVEATNERRDASRMLASASLALQRFTQTAAEPVIVPPGPRAILEQQSSVIVASLPPGELDQTRRSLVENACVPVLLVRPGLRPSGVAPDHTLTRFSWSLREPEIDPG